MFGGRALAIQGQQVRGEFIGAGIELTSHDMMSPILLQHYLPMVAINWMMARYSAI